MEGFAWRLLVIVDGAAPVAPRRVERDSLPAWLASLGARCALPGGTPYALDAPEAFDPRRIAQALGAAASPAAVDAVLHAPDLQRAEAAWRGLSLLLEHTTGPVEVWAAALPRAGRVDAFRDHVHGPGLAAETPWSLIVLDADVTHRANDVAELAALAAMAADLQAPLVVNAGAGFFELRYLVQSVAIPDLASRLTGSAYSAWQTFQRGEDARWVCVTLNRFLLRDPWAIDTHTETCTESQPDTYLWGRGGWLVAAAVARSVAAHGHALDLSGTGGRFGNRPTRAYPVKANEAKALATEIPFAETQMMLLAHAAFAPLVGPLNQDVVSLPLVATAHRYGPGRLTVEGTLAYQLTASRVALECGALVGALEGGAGADAVVATLGSGLRARLAGMLGEAPEAVQVEVREATAETPRTAAVTLRPPVSLEGKSPVFALELALEG